MKLLKNSYVLAILTYVALWILVLAAHFPYHYDNVTAAPALSSSESFYNKVYSSSGDDLSTDYAATEIDAAAAVGTEAQVRDFVARYDLRGKKALEVGAGRGTLQDVVDDYTGLDISATAARFYHKRFVQGSATELPFPDNEFDAAWTIWTFEHVPEPDKALYELRRVLKPGGL